MASRKLQKDIDIIFKKIQEGLHDFNYHYERYDSINTDEDSDNQREKEKLENDLKKEIKRLQKFREQIKIWQQNESIKTLALNSNALTGKLTENKKMIEEAMEVYKDVERTSKLKTFSNQSILMATLDQQNADDDDSSGDDSDSDIYINDEDLDAFDFGNDEDMEDYNHLSPESIEVIKFLFEFLGQINDQTKKLNSEFEKLSHKKLRKNNLSIIEAKKEKIKSTKSSNKFHSKKIMKLVKYIKGNKIPDLALVWLIKDDLRNYLASNSDANYEYDSSIYDDIFNSVVSENYASEEPEAVEAAEEPVANSINLSAQSVLSNNDSHVQSNNSHGVHGQQNHAPPKPAAVIPESLSRSPASPEMASPAIIKVLKPASTPSKPVDGLKWSAAAAVGLPTAEALHPIAPPVANSISSGLRNVGTAISISPASAGSTKAINLTEGNIPALNNQSKSFDNTDRKIVLSRTAVPPPLKAQATKPNTPLEDIKSINSHDSNAKFVKVLKNSSLCNIELNVFSDMNMYKLPPGIQDMVLSFTSKRNNSEEFSLLYDSDNYEPYGTPIRKPYLPPQIQSNIKNNGPVFKIPLQYVKLQSYWNKIRASNQFEQLASEIETLQAQSLQQIHQQTSPAEIINELTSVFFFGYYHGLTPIENLIAESFLFQLGWTPYGSRSQQQQQQQDGSFKFADGTIKSSSFLYWFKCIKLTSASEEPHGSELGDYQVFDLSAWEFFVKLGFTFEYDLSRTSPSTAIC